MMTPVKFEEYLEGRLLWGDDFTDTELASWHADEKNAYAELGAKVKAHYNYIYEELNRHHGFSRLPSGKAGDVLGVGSAWGHELRSVMDDAASVTILEPSDAFTQDTVFGKPVRYSKPGPNGAFSFPDSSFDLITCFGVLHHIPNVSYVVSEMARCLRKDGYLLLRESITSMGDWRKPRRGVTGRERGIPLALFRGIINKAGLRILTENYCMFPLASRLNLFIKKPAYNSKIVVIADHLLATLFRFNYSYHARSFAGKLRPTSVFYVLAKR